MRKDAKPRNNRPNRAPGNGQRAMVLTAAAATVLVASLLARGVVGREAVAHAPGASHEAPQAADLPAGGPPHDVMAIVNGKDISRQTLVQSCVERHGERVLEALVNKRLIEHHCRNRGVTVTDADIDAEIDRMAKRFKLGREQWLALLKEQRGVDEAEYKRDILWPTLALRKLAAERVQPTEEELRRAYETKFGRAVRARLIVMTDASKAAEVRREAAARPAEFARLAMQHSQDVNSASIGGLVQPIRPHAGDPRVERAAFALKPGEVSDVVSLEGQNVIVKCEGHVPPRNVPMSEVREQLAESITEEKLRGVANTLFQQLQDAATIQNVYNDPRLRDAMPGVVATVNGERVTMKELGQECLARHGEETLEIEVSQTLLRQALDGAGLTVTQQDVEAEMDHAAKLAGVVDQSGRPDRRAWLRMATTEQGVTQDQYYRDSLWPSAALKKLTSGGVEVTDEDLQKGFQANYGERVRCRAIVLGSLRRAQEVWDKARQNPSLEFFGDLAEEYSIEPTSRSLRGETPPVRRFGGQPQLEDVAFALADGELSGIIQVGDKFVILRCEGRTEPLDVSPEEVREELTRDIYEKKLRIAMAQEFERVRGAARIDNYLTGTSQAPAAKESVKTAGRRRDNQVRPTAGVR